MGDKDGVEQQCRANPLFYYNRSCVAGQSLVLSIWSNSLLSAACRFVAVVICGSVGSCSSTLHIFPGTVTDTAFLAVLGGACAGAADSLTGKAKPQKPASPALLKAAAAAAAARPFTTGVVDYSTA